MPRISTSPLRSRLAQAPICTTCLPIYTTPPRDLHHLRPDTPPAAIPASLARRIHEAGNRPRQQTIRSLLLDLCAHGPKSAAQLARLLGDRDAKNLVRLHLAPMLAAGQLAYTIPKMVNHPDQKYTLPGEPVA